MANLSNINGKFVVDTAGNIGVGTLTPRSDANTTNISIQSSGTARLFVNNTGASGKEYAIYSSANGDFGIFDYGAVSARLVINSAGNATFAGTVIGTIARFDTLNDSANSKNLIYRDSSGAKTVVGGGSTPDKIYILDGGNVGIGASLPSTPLTVNRASNSTLPTLYLDTNGGGGGSVGLGQNTAIGPYLVGNTLPNGNVRGAYSASRMLFNGGGFSFQTSNETSGARTFDDKMKILINGNVGIGITSPQQLLHINETSNTANPGIQVQGGVFGFTLNKAPQSADYVHLKPLGSGISVLRVMPNTSSSTSYIEAWGTDYEADTSNWNRLYMNVTGSSGNATITTDSSGTGAVGNLYLGTNSNQQTLTILDSGNVGIGTASPIAKQHNVITSSGTALLLNNSLGGTNAYVDLDFNTYLVTGAGFANAAASIRVIDDGSYSGNITFRTKGASIGASQTERMRIASNGDITMQENLFFNNGAAFRGAASIRQQSDILILTGGGNGFAFNDDTNAVSNMLIDSGGTVTIPGVIESGGGIKLGGTATANKLDDYEEGTFQTNINSTNVTNYSYSGQNGRYTKIGRQVIVTFVIDSVTAGTGFKYFVISNLPFAQHTNSHNDQGYCNNYPRGERRSGIIINNSSGNNNQWYVGYNNNSSQSGDAFRGTIIYTTT